MKILLAILIYTAAIFCPITDCKAQTITFTHKRDYTFSTREYTFSPIDYPGAVSTIPNGLNDNGKIVGSYRSASDFKYRCFTYDNSFFEFEYPEATDSYCIDINNSDMVVGVYSYDITNPNLRKGFIYESEGFAEVVYPSGDSTLLTNVDNTGRITGYLWDDNTFPIKSFTYNVGSFFDIDLLNVLRPRVRGANDNGHVVGEYYIISDSNSYFRPSQGFLLENNTVTTFSIPGAVTTSLSSINNQGHIVGHYKDGTTSQYHGFLYADGVLSLIDYPGAYDTFPLDINDNGQIVGHFKASSDSYVSRGFIATLTPSVVALAGSDQIIYDEISLDASQSTGAVASYQWDIKRQDGWSLTTNGVSPVVSSLEKGFYAVTLTVTDSEGASATDTMVFSATGRKGDFDSDGDVDGVDLDTFSSEFGK